MRLLPWILMTGALSSTVGCSWTSDGGLTARYESSNETITQSGDVTWSNEPLTISSSSGSVSVVGVPGKTGITVHARFVAGANSQADADAAFADVSSGITLEKRDGTWLVECPHARSWHGSVDPESTGCSSLRVEVPAGTTAAPLHLSVVSAFGGIHIRGVTVSKLDAQAPFGIVADVTPVSESEIRLWGADLVTGMCSSVLRIPPESTLGSVSLSVSNPDVTYAGVAADDERFWLGTFVQGFPNGPSVSPRTGSYEWKKGSAPYAAKQIEVHASLGKALLTTAPVPEYQPFNQCENADLKIATE